LGICNEDAFLQAVMLFGIIRLKLKVSWPCGDRIKPGTIVVKFSKPSAMKALLRIVEVFTPQV
jgi:hypothetical protein